MMKLMVFVVLSLKAVLISFSQEDQSLKGFNKGGVPGQSGEKIRLKELAKIQPTNSSVLTGIGIVAGLAGKGDTLKKDKEALSKILTQIGIKGDGIELNSIESKNIALVHASLRINGNMIEGSSQDVHVASVLDSKDLTNGLLLRTELKNGEGKIIAIASGPVTTNEKSRGTGLIAKGATIHESKDYSRYNIILKKENYTLADEISKKLNQKGIKNNIKSGNIIEIEIEKIGLLSEIEQIKIETSPVVLINETDKTVMASKNAEIGPLMLLIERNENNSFGSKKNEKVKIEIQKMNLSEFISKNVNALTNDELITIIKKSKKINKLNGELILEEQNAQ
ncbi:flagellar basal body P-ring protein FlgI [Borrelia sp. P9F1]|uniref:flagellar basal body P-ring protein FlgI n=1 Tax=Borrelia sp. P9F1 TaxID=3058374 RepID=UPI002648E732|nr:flagellar basal body P-ring protein FlgI [Borrelia sp. P9F1]WKC58304.1 flagellar basal body P-ring protein FlgI [Borrelia sp. P9F1]